MGIIRSYRVSHWLYVHHMKPIALVIKGWNRIIWGAVIPPSVEIGKGTFITYHGLGVVMHRK